MFNHSLQQECKIFASKISGQFASVLGGQFNRFMHALQRMGLVQSREEKVIQIKAQIRRVEEAIINLNNHFEDSNEKTTWFEGILRRELNILNQFKEADKEYAGIARYIIENYFNNLP